MRGHCGAKVKIEVSPHTFSGPTRQQPVPESGVPESPGIGVVGAGSAQKFARVPEKCSAAPWKREREKDSRCIIRRYHLHAQDPC